MENVENGNAFVDEIFQPWTIEERKEMYKFVVNELKSMENVEVPPDHEEKHENYTKLENVKYMFHNYMKLSSSVHFYFFSKHAHTFSMIIRYVFNQSEFDLESIYKISSIFASMFPCVGMFIPKKWVKVDNETKEIAYKQVHQPIVVLGYNSDLVDRETYEKHFKQMVKKGLLAFEIAGRMFIDKESMINVVIPHSA
jgi:hypothetical protein